MSSQAILGLWIIGGFLLVCIGEGAAIVVLVYKMGVYRGKLERYQLAEKYSITSER